MPRIGTTVPMKKNGDFSRAYRSTKTQAHPLAVTYVRRNRLGQKRLGITTSRKIGGAVERNRAKRIIRAAFAAIEPEVPRGWDIVVVARTRTTKAKSTALVPVLRRHLETLGVLRAPEQGE